MSDRPSRRIDQPITSGSRDPRVPGSQVGQAQSSASMLTSPARGHQTHAQGAVQREPASSPSAPVPKPASTSFRGHSQHSSGAAPSTPLASASTPTKAAVRDLSLRSPTASKARSLAPPPFALHPAGLGTGLPLRAKRSQNTTLEATGAERNRASARDDSYALIQRAADATHDSYMMAPTWLPWTESSASSVIPTPHNTNASGAGRASDPYAVSRRIAEHVRMTPSARATMLPSAGPAPLSEMSGPHGAAAQSKEPGITWGRRAPRTRYGEREPKNASEGKRERTRAAGKMFPSAIEETGRSGATRESGAERRIPRPSSGRTVQQQLANSPPGCSRSEQRSTPGGISAPSSGGGAAQRRPRWREGSYAFDGSSSSDAVSDQQLPLSPLPDDQDQKSARPRDARRRTTKDEVDKIWTLHNLGFGPAEIESKTGINRATVADWLRKGEGATPARSIYDEKTKAAVFAMATKEAMSARAISIETGIPKSNIERWIRGTAESRVQRGHDRSTEGVTLFRQGMTPVQIAEKLGVHANSVYRWLKKEGLGKRMPDNDDARRVKARLRQGELPPDLARETGIVLSKIYQWYHEARLEVAAEAAISDSDIGRM